MRTHFVISDTQVKPSVSQNHIDWLARAICHYMPNEIVCLGDWWDMESLSTYDMGTINAEGKRYYQDIEAGNEAMKRLINPIKKRMKLKKKWKPKFTFLLGNHEQRILRTVKNYPHLKDKLSYDDLYLKDWKVFDFLKVAKIDGVSYSHYFVNPMTGNPYGGNIQNLIAKLGYSFVMGHKQVLEFGRKDLTDGNVVMGLITGSYYLHDEMYKGPQGNYHWRGCCVLHNVRSGVFDLETLSLDRMKREYGK